MKVTQHTRAEFRFTCESMPGHTFVVLSDTPEKATKTLKAQLQGVLKELSPKITKVGTQQGEQKPNH